MCLRTVDKVKDSKYADPLKVHVGWKTIKTNKDKKGVFTLPVRYQYDEQRFGTWMESIPRRVTSGQYGWYTSGYHIYTNRKDARAFAKYREKKGMGRHNVVKVFYKEVLHTGTQGNGVKDNHPAKCIVAKHMKVLSPVQSRRKARVLV